MRELRGRTAIVTGASRGLGPYIARALANEGMKLVLAARSVEPLAGLAAELRERGTEAIAVPGDVASADDRARLIARTEEAFGAIDVLVNNAGIDHPSPFEQLEPPEIERIVAADLVAPLLLTHAALPGMLQRRRGHVVNVGSLAGKTPLPFSGTYAAAKAGLTNFTRSLAAEYDGSGVHFSVISPGRVLEAGMYVQAMGEAGLPVRRSRFTTTPERVARATVQAIKEERLDVMVPGGSVWVYAAALTLFPGLGPRFFRRSGRRRSLRRLAEGTEFGLTKGPP